MNKDDDAVEYPLHPNSKDGLYYWVLKKYAYTIKPLGDWGPQYHKTSNMNHDWDSHDQSFNNDVVNVLPGAPGQAVIKDGNSIGEYKLVKCSEKMENASKDTGIDCTLFMNFSFFVLMVVYLSRNYE